MLWTTLPAPHLPAWPGATSLKSMRVLEARQALTSGGVLADGCHCRPHVCLRLLLSNQWLLKHSLAPLLLLVSQLMLMHSSAFLGTPCLVNDEAPLHEPHIVELAGAPCSRGAIFQLPSTASKLLQFGSSVATTHPLPTASQLLQSGSGVAISQLPPLPMSCCSQAMQRPPPACSTLLIS